MLNAVDSMNRPMFDVEPERQGDILDRMADLIDAGM